MFAIVEAGGRQEKVAPGALVIVDRLEAEAGAKITFDKVLLVGDRGRHVRLGQALRQGRLGHRRGRGPDRRARRFVVFKFKRRKGYRRTKGHRSQQTRVRVESINV